MERRPTAKDAYREGKLPLPPGYGLEHGAGVLLLRRADGSVAATFSAGGRPRRTWRGPPKRTTRGPPEAVP